MSINDNEERDVHKLQQNSLSPLDPTIFSYDDPRSDLIRDPILFKWHLTNSIETKLHLVFFQFIHKCNSSQVWIHICGLNIAFGCHFCHIWFYWVPTNDMGVKCLFGQCHIRRGVITGGGDATSLIPNSSLVLYLHTVAPALPLYLSKSDIWSIFPEPLRSLLKFSQFFFYSWLLK